MIDLHNHILPGVDDGAADLAESLAIARQFLSEGVTAVAATPHLDPLRGTGTRAPEARQAVAGLNEALSEADVALTVRSGSEVFLTPDVPALLAAGMVATIADGPWVVVELPFDHRPTYLEDTLLRIEAAGYRPILAHPERYRFVQRDAETLDHLADRGLVLQLTAPGLLGEYGTRVRRAAERLLLRGRYALASSDRHHPGQQRSLALTRARIAELRDGQTAELLLVANPSRVIAGEEVEWPGSSESGRSTWSTWLRRR